MEVLKWFVMAVASLVGGYFWHKLTGNWTSAVAVTVTLAVVLSMLASTRWTAALVCLAIGAYAAATLVNDGIDPLTTKSANKLPVQATAAPASADAPASQPALTLAQPAASTPAVGASAAASGTPPTAQGGASTLAGNAFKDCTDCPELVRVPDGRFTMGYALRKGESADAADPRELPTHRVAVRAFAVGRYAVTRAEFAAFVAATRYQTEAERSGGCFAWEGDKWKSLRKAHWREPGFAQEDDHPVVCVSWNDAQAYVQWLSQATRRDYRLLSEAEREYVTRAGTTSTFWWGETLSPTLANYDTSAPDYRGSHQGEWRRATVAVNSFNANPFGLYNVHGNVWEWTQDCQHDSYVGAPVDGSAWTTKCQEDKRMLRGGAWVGEPAGLRASNRVGYTPDFRLNSGGFRVARSADAPRK
jgi:formylglycine-generating enzyme required for sulfatase activity